MATKTLKTRIQLKYDTYKNWTDNNPTPLSGELCVVVVPAEAGAVVQEPALLLKVGDGSTPFNSLNFVGGVAADVYDWAKAATKPAYKANEITGIDTYISEYVNEQMGISVDTDTQYTIVKVTDYQYKLMSKSKADETYATEVAVIDIPKYDDTALAGRVSANETAIATLNGDASTVGSVAKAIADAIAALDLANTYDAKGAAAAVQGNTTTTVKGVEDALNTYKTTNDEAIAAAQQAADDAQADVDALAEKVGEVPADKTVVQMISDAQSAATYDDTEVRGLISDNADDISEING